MEALYDNGYAHLTLGDRSLAAHSSQRAIQVSQHISFAHGVLINRLALADIAWRGGDFAEAVASANDVVERARRLEDRANTVSGLILLLLSLSGEGNTKKSLAHAREAVSVAQQSSSKLLEAEALDTEGETLLKLGGTGRPHFCLIDVNNSSRNIGGHSFQSSDWQANNTV